jgi:hypothetical protein
MVARALPTVSYYKLSFGEQDNLQKLVKELINKGIDPESSIETSARAALEILDNELDTLSAMVPSRFIRPWLPDSNGLRSSQLTSYIESYSIESQKTANPTPYEIVNRTIILNNEWRQFLIENKVAIEDYTKLRLVSFLESRNPSSPNITQKLSIPTDRNLIVGKEFWKRTLEKNKGTLMNIYTARPLEANFAVDHFVPFSFEASDLLWNLIPTDQSSNSKKSDKLPSLDKYLIPYVDAHYLGIHSNADNDKILIDYRTALSLDTKQLLSLPKNEFFERIRKLITPRVEQARNSGFQNMNF